MKVHTTSSFKIQIIGAGGIVNDAHLPAYNIAGYPVAGIFDIDKAKASVLQKKFNLPKVYGSIEEMVSNSDHSTIFDVAVPGSEIFATLQKLPNHAVVLIQKPMGNNLDEAIAIRSLCREKQIIAGMNFQLRYAPFILKARELISDGTIGELCDLEININVYTPWHLWTFLNEAPRVEILYHSIHYIDLIRSFIGNPKSIYARTLKHPQVTNLASVKSNILMDYNEFVRAHIHTNHNHNFGDKHQHAFIKFEGSKGAIRVELGLLKNYPEGDEDVFEWVEIKEGEQAKWQKLDIDGSWFPHAFIGSMSEMIKVMNDRNYVPDNSIEDCIHTMACVESAYQSSKSGAVSVVKV
ncbi:Gfo/Idh/MocA family protein [Anditalea andensis]|nr:Gfo/Idh/MocA family oxidoreductase [Anditalea andensis]